jgi:hypothetical protein
MTRRAADCFRQCSLPDSSPPDLRRPPDPDDSVVQGGWRLRRQRQTSVTVPIRRTGVHTMKQIERAALMLRLTVAGGGLTAERPICRQLGVLWSTPRTIS